MKYASLFRTDPSIRYHESSINRRDESIFFLLLLTLSIFIYVTLLRIYYTHETDSRTQEVVTCKNYRSLYLSSYEAIEVQTKRDTDM